MTRQERFRRTAPGSCSGWGFVGGRGMDEKILRFVRRIRERGSITVPTEVREAAGLGYGDIVELEVIGVVKKKNESRVAAETFSPATLPGRLEPKEPI